MTKINNRLILLRIIFILLPLSIYKHTISQPLYENKLSDNSDYISYPFIITGQWAFGFTTVLTEIRKIYSKNKEELTNDSYKILKKNFNVNTLGIDLGWLQINKFFCNHFGGYPIIGLSIIYRNFIDVNGHSFSLIPFIHIQRSYKAIFSFNPKLGFGVSYNSIPLAKRLKYIYAIQGKKDLYGDPLYKESIELYGVHHDTKIRSDFGFEFMFGLNFKIRPTNNITIDTNFNINYLPNMKTLFNIKEKKEEFSKMSAQKKKIQNLEKMYVYTDEKNINIYSIGLGISYIPNPQDLTFFVKKDKNYYTKTSIGFSKKEYNKKTEYYLRNKKGEMPNLNDKHFDTYSSDFYKFAFKNERKDREKLYNFIVLSMEYGMKYTYNHAIILGIELTYDSSIPAVLKNIDLLTANNPLTLGFTIGHESTFGKFIIGGILGIHPFNTLINAYQQQIGEFPFLKTLSNELLDLSLKFQFKILKNLIIGYCIRNKIELSFIEDDKVISLPNIAINLGYPEIFISFIA